MTHSLLALRVKCPVCSESLMDPEHPLDNQPSILLTGRFAGQECATRLSSVYGSFQVGADCCIPEGTVVEFACPRCHNGLESAILCETCHAPMVRLLMADGGRLYVCSRRGCRKHFVEFEDMETALGKFYDAYAVGAGAYHELNLEEMAEVEVERAGGREVLSNGSYLYTYCPHCQRSLIKDHTMHFVMMRPNGEEGTLALSPYLNIFTHCCSIEIPEGEEAKDLLCPHCRASLLEEGKRCDRCGAHTARTTLLAMRKLIGFHICLRKGCTWHGLSQEDARLIQLEDSDEW